MDEVAKQRVKTIGKKDGLLSFRWHCIDQGIDPFEAGARLVNFHGPFMPDNKEIQDEFRWTQLYNAYVTPKSKPLKGRKGWKAGAPDPMNDLKRKHCEAIYRNGGTDSDICHYMGVKDNEIRRYFKKYPWMKEAKDRAEAYRNQSIEPYKEN
jgi:hypothetical protein